MRWFVLLLIIAFGPSLQASDPKIDQDYFEKSIRPLLAERCQNCHNATKAKGGLDLSSRAGFLTGGDTGPTFAKADPAKSLFLEVIRYDGEMKMPKSGKLPEAEIAMLTKWIEAGAPWPADGATVVAGPRGLDVPALAARHWSFQPIRTNHAPDATIDGFIRQKLAAVGLRPAERADPATLLRRLSYDLIGLPPTLQEIEAFEAASAKNPQAAFDDAVERLLASPHYGERWGRHWLDLVRYAETRGHEFDFEIPDAWRYRDYVVRAFNENLPYDRFVREQVAGDRLPPRWEPREQTNEALIATGFWHLGEGLHSPVDVREDEAHRIENMIDVFGKTFLGLTIACARCHDHKFDPIPTADYYSLYGILGSSRYAHAIIDNPAKTEQLLKELATLRGEPKVPPRTPSAENEWTKQSKLFEDFRGDWAKSWFPSGPAFRLTQHLPHSGRESVHVVGALRSPTFKIPAKYLAVRVAGRGAQLRVILNHLQLIQDPIYGGLRKTINHGEEFQWAVFDLSMWPGHAAYLEVLDDGDGFVAIDEVRFAESPPPGNWPKSSCDAPAEVPKDSSRIAQLEAELAAAPRRAITMTDGNGVNEQIFIRGGSKSLGVEVERRFLEVFAGSEARSPASGSGRLELARELTRPTNPLLARVFVNRVWQHHFGVGLVASVDDFGKQGRLPTHPELLDFLAAEFIRDGWNIKNLHRRILRSATYQQTSTPHPETAPKVATVDPRNELLHCARVQRLEAEIIRDAMLAVSGRLDRDLGGPGVPPALNEHMIGRGRPGRSGPIDGNGRRSIYLQVRRNFLNPFFTAFDYPTPFTTIGRRSVSNVPAQALVMLNNPFVLGEARRWAKRILSGSPATAEQRIMQMYQEAFNRKPTSDELKSAADFIREQNSKRGESEPWDELAHALFNAKEFIFIE